MKALRLLVIAFALVYCLGASCAGSAKPILHTALDIARAYCVMIYGEQKTGLSAEEIQQQFCATEEQLHPFLQVVLSNKAGLMRAQSDAGVDATAPADDSTLTVYVLVRDYDAAVPRDGRSE